MTNQPTEIAIVGGGMVGGALALGLAQHGFSVTVIEHAEPAPFVADSQPDVRISAISAASDTSAFLTEKCSSWSR